LIRQGDSIENQVTGERLVFLKTSQETNGELVVVEAFVQPTGFVASAHLHPYQEERFHVLRGTVGFRLHRSSIYAGPGQRITVPAGTPHKFWNAGEDEAHFECEIRPALQFEQLIETMFGLAADRKTNRKGMPNRCGSPSSLVLITTTCGSRSRLSGCSGWDSPWAHRSGDSRATRRAMCPRGLWPRSMPRHRDRGRRSKKFIAPMEHRYGKEQARFSITQWQVKGEQDHEGDGVYRGSAYRTRCNCNCDSKARSRDRHTPASWRQPKPRRPGVQSSGVARSAGSR
jgi:mannose-6-phosphate isomerase-like protein (cupin superfamily)